MLGVAAQRAITEMRRAVQAHVARLPVRYFDTDADRRADLARHDRRRGHPESRRHRPRAARSAGSLTAIIALGVLFYLNWQLTLVTLVVLGAFGGIMAVAFKRLRPLFRERGKINAEVTGRLAQSLGGIRIVKAYTAEKREELVFTQGRPPPVPQRRPVDHRRLRRVRPSPRSSSASSAC